MKRLLLFFTLALLSNIGIAQKTFIKCGNLIDGISNQARTGVTLVVEDKKIIEILTGLINGGPYDKTIDLSNKTVLPGLIDCHVHLEFQTGRNFLLDGFRQTDADIAYIAARYARITLMAGFTTVRDLGGSGVNISLRNAINKGLTEGPNILTAGRALSSSGGHMDKSTGFRDDVWAKQGPDDGVADGKDEAIKAVRLQMKRGSDLIKIASTGGVLDLSNDATCSQFSLEEIRAIVETAKDYGMRVACHAHGTEGIKRAIIAGVNSIEHGSYLGVECIELMKKHGTWLCPTLTAGASVTDSAKIPGYFPPTVAAKGLQVCPNLQRSFAAAYKAGVKIAFGTDAGVYVLAIRAKFA